MSARRQSSFVAPASCRRARSGRLEAGATGSGYRISSADGPTLDRPETLLRHTPSLVAAASSRQRNPRRQNAGATKNPTAPGIVGAPTKLADTPGRCPSGTGAHFGKIHDPRNSAATLRPNPNKARGPFAQQCFAPTRNTEGCRRADRFCWRQLGCRWAICGAVLVWAKAGAGLPHSKGWCADVPCYRQV